MLDARKRKRTLFLFLASSIQHPASSIFPVFSPSNRV
jgi:hypothetical protein